MFPRFATSLVIALFASVSLTSALPITSAIGSALRWRTPFGKHLVADSLVELEWEGGSGNGYDVYFIPQWPENTDIEHVSIAQTSSTSLKWRVPAADAYPEQTTFILVVRDQAPISNGKRNAYDPTQRTIWYDTTSTLELTSMALWRRA